MKRRENRSTRGKTGVPGEKPEYLGKNRSTRRKTGVPGEKPEYPGKNRSTWGKTGVPGEKPEYPEKNWSTRRKTGVPGEKPDYPEKNRSTREKTGVPGEKPEYPGKNRSTRGKTSRCREENQKPHPTYDVESGNRTRATLVEGECFSPLFHHCSPQLCLLKSAYVLSRVIRDITGGEWGGRRVFPILLLVSMWARSAPFFFHSCVCWVEV